MSQTGTHGPRPAVRRSPTPASPARPRIRVAPPVQPRAPRAPFVMMVLVLLIGGLASLLLLNTLLAQGSFAVRDLTLQVADLQDEQQALQQRVAGLAAPQRLARRAAEMGMVPSVNPVFVRMGDGKVLGKPSAATAPVVPQPSQPPSRQPTEEGTTPANQQSNDVQTAPDQSGQEESADQGSSGSGNQTP